VSEDNNANVRLSFSQICLRNASQNETPFHFAHHASLQFTIVGPTNKTQQTTKICYINQINTTCKQRKTQIYIHIYK
jgi:hypothetical protein